MRNAPGGSSASSLRLGRAAALALLVALSGCGRALGRPEPDAALPCSLDPDAAEPLTGAHVVVRPGGLRQGNPSATRTATELAVAFQGSDAAETEHHLALALAPLDGAGAPGEFRLSDPVAIAPPETGLLPRLLGRPGGYWLAHLEVGLAPEPRQGPVLWTRLDARGAPVDGPNLTGLEACGVLRAAASATADASPGTPDALAMVCAAGHEDGGPWIWSGHSVRVTVAPSPGGSSAPVTLDTCRNTTTPIPAVVWDGAAFTVIYLCELEAGRMELRLARVDGSGQVAAAGLAVHAFDVDDDEERPGQVGAAWDGTAIAVVWMEPGPPQGPRFGRVLPSGAWAQAPVELSEGAEAAPGALELVPVAGGLALLSSHCVLGLDSELEFGWICGLDPVGTSTGCLRWTGWGCSSGAPDPGEIAAVGAGAGLRVIFADQLGDEREAVFHAGWSPPGSLDGPPRPIAPPAGALRPLALGGTDGRALVLGVDPIPHRFASDPELADYHLYAVDPRSAVVERHAPPALAGQNDYLPAVAADADRVALLVQGSHVDAPVLTVLGAEGAVQWSRDLTPLIGPDAWGQRLGLEPDGVRVLFRDAGADDAWYDVLVTATGESPRRAVGEPDLGVPVGHGGVYFARAEVLDPLSGALGPSGSLVVERYDPAASDRFLPFARTTVGSAPDAWFLGLAAGPGLVGALVTVDGGQTFLSWEDPAGAPRAPCRLHGTERTWATWTATADGVALLLLGLEPEVAPLWWLVPAAASPRLLALDLPGPVGWSSAAVRPWTTPEALELVWREAASGEVILSRWSW